MSPQHIAIIMDGNGRWARQRGEHRTSGHRKGVETARRVVEACVEREVEVLSLFAFSSENWQRPHDEVGVLMELFITALASEIDALHENAVRVRFIGDRAPFSAALRAQIDEAESLTRDNRGLQLIIAMNYGGRWDIGQAASRIARKVRDGELEPEAVTADEIGTELATSDLPEPDLFVRTGGEQRISNFLLWQLAYTELYFTDVLWPDFAVSDLDWAIDWFAQRQRRFGRTGEQLERPEDA